MTPPVELFNPSLLQADQGVPVTETVPPEAVGRWNLRDPGPSSAACRFEPDGRHYIQLRPDTYALSADGLVLTINGRTFTRDPAVSGGLDGFWRADQTVNSDFLLDGANRWEFGDDDVAGSAYVEYPASPGDTMILWPLRSYAVFDATTITFFPVNRNFSAVLDYTLAGDVLTMIVSGGDNLVYDRA